MAALRLPVIEGSELVCHDCSAFVKMRGAGSLAPPDLVFIKLSFKRAKFVLSTPSLDCLASISGNLKSIWHVGLGGVALVSYYMSIPST